MAFLVKFFLVLLFCTLCQSEVIVKPRSVLAKVGDNVTFHCRTDNTENDIVWNTYTGRENIEISFNSEIFEDSEAKGFSVVGNKTTGEYSLTIKNVTMKIIYYICIEFYGSNLRDTKSVQLNVLLDDPDIVTTVDHHLHTIVANVTFEYRGEQLRVIWIITRPSGKKVIPHSKNSRGIDNLVNASLEHTLKHVETIQIQIYGENSGRFPKLYEVYQRHHHSDANFVYDDDVSNGIIINGVSWVLLLTCSILIMAWRHDSNPSI